MPIDEANEIVCAYHEKQERGREAGMEWGVDNRITMPMSRHPNDKIKGDESVMNVCYATRSNSLALSVVGFGVGTVFSGGLSHLAAFRNECEESIDITISFVQGLCLSVRL